MTHPLVAIEDTALAVELCRKMVLLRVLDERILVFHRHGRIGNFPISWGQEAIHAGAVAALRDTDWLFPTYRDGGMGLLRRMPARILLAQARGHHEGWWNPRDWCLAPCCIPVATHIPHAVGFAWGERLQGKDTVALAIFGDGATSEGEFHEGLNFAAILRAPVVLLCSNNQWAISTPLDRQTRAARLADKGIGYGMPAECIDGYDVLAVHAAVKRARTHASEGRGPTLIECVTYRAVGHTASDEPPTYRTVAENALGRERDCVKELAARLIAERVLTEQELAAFREDALRVIAEGIAEAEALPAAGPDLLFDNTFETMPPDLRRDLDLVKELEERAAAKLAQGRK